MKKALCMFLCFIFLISCSAFKSNTQAVSITCAQPDTRIKVNGDSFSCPSKIDVRRDSKLLIEASKEGYTSYSKTIDYHLSTTGKLDIIGTAFIFFSVFGVLYPGAWDLDQTELNINLDKTVSASTSSR